MCVLCRGMRTWAGLVRVSHMGLRTADASDFRSEREQVAALQRAAKGLGGTLDVLPSELDVSGGRTLAERPSLSAAVEGVETGRYAGVIVAFQDRLARNVEVDEEVTRRVEAAGGKVVYALDPIDTTTVDGRMMRRFRAAMNTAVRERHVERFDDLRRVTVAEGIWQRRQTPLGYERDPATRRLRPDSRADLVRQAFRDRASGVAMVEIADNLGMTASGARALLRNRVYLGELRVGRHVNQEAHPALVTTAEWDAAQIQQPRPSRARDRPPALLAGLVRCVGCGHVMSRSTTAREVYACHGRSSAGRCPEPAAIVSAALDEYVERVARAELERLSITATLAAPDVDRLRDEVRAAERELSAYVEAISVEDVGPETFAAGARQRRQAVETAQAELRRVLALRPSLPEYGDAAEAWDRLDGAERNTVLRGLVEVVLVRRVGRGRRVPVGERVRVIAFGSGFPVPRKLGDVPLGIVPLPFPDVDGEGVLGVAGVKDGG